MAYDVNPGRFYAHPLSPVPRSVHSGRLKVERDGLTEVRSKRGLEGRPFDDYSFQGYFACLKSYLLRGPGGVKRELKFKSFVNRSEMSDESLMDLAEGKCLLSETRTELVSRGRGMEVVDRTVTAGSYRSTLNYKFYLKESGDIASH